MFTFQNIEKISFVAPLGLCFHDAATGERIVDGLSVSVFPASGNVWKNRERALPNRVGVYVLQKACGLEDFANGAGDAEFWRNNPPNKLYIAEVFDTEKRFQPFQFTIKLPVKGIYQWENTPTTSPNKNLASIPLYSAPTRKLMGGMSVIRAHLREAGGNPASWAVLEARVNSTLVARGIADRDGQIVLMFPALPPQNNPFTSPPSNAVRVSLLEQQWLLDITVKYEPTIFQTSPPSSTKDDEEVFPDLRLALAQAKGKLWADAGQTEEYKTAALQLGKELVLRSRAPKILSPMPVAELAFSSYLLVNLAN